MPPYHLYLHGRVYEALARLSRSQCTTLFIFFKNLTNDPLQPADYVESVEGFTVNVKLMGGHAVLYHADHAVKEIKIVDLRDADQF